MFTNSRPSYDLQGNYYGNYGYRYRRSIQPDNPLYLPMIITVSSVFIILGVYLTVTKNEKDRHVLGGAIFFFSGLLTLILGVWSFMVR